MDTRPFECVRELKAPALSEDWNGQELTVTVAEFDDAFVSLDLAENPLLMWSWSKTSPRRSLRAVAVPHGGFHGEGF